MNNKPALLMAQIIENREIQPGYFLLRLDSPLLAAKVRPGQFFNVRVTDRLDMILRRPFSVFDYDQTSISILYEVVGKGTAIMSNRDPGEDLDILGPLGRGFVLPEETKKALMVGGGMGIAPLFSWAKKLLQIKNRGREIDIQVIMGAANEYKVLCQDNFMELGLPPVVCTDDGSYGKKGLATGLMKKQITADDKQATVVYACGPDAMLKELAGILKGYQIKGQISMDRHMGCGLGACMGCVVETIGGKYKRVCQEGPVFPADEIVWQ